MYKSFPVLCNNRDTPTHTHTHTTHTHTLAVALSMLQLYNYCDVIYLRIFSVMQLAMSHKKLASVQANNIINIWHKSSATKI